MQLFETLFISGSLCVCGSKTHAHTRGAFSDKVVFKNCTTALLGGWPALKALKALGYQGVQFWCSFGHNCTVLS